VDLRRLVALVLLLLLIGSVPASASTTWVTNVKSVGEGVKDRHASSSIGFSAASASTTVNRVDGARLRIRTTDGKEAKVDVSYEIFCANGSERPYAQRTITTKPDGAWTNINLFKPGGTKRGTCWIFGDVWDERGTKASSVELRIQTVKY
jgi:hypothetical protein